MVRIPPGSHSPAPRVPSPSAVGGLTGVDRRGGAVGGGKRWKWQLLTELYDVAEEVLRLGHKHKGRKERIEAKQQRLQAALGLPDKEFSALRKRFPESY